MTEQDHYIDISIMEGKDILDAILDSHRYKDLEQRKAVIASIFVHCADLLAKNDVSENTMLEVVVDTYKSKKTSE
jgi:phage FluMu protein gp41